jgi:phosphoribosyl 1,2-cyclic phosphate phosphodiesterase
MSIMIDTSPDLKTQLRKNSITNVDAVIYSHEHADQTSGIFELRPFFWKNKKKIDIYGSKKTINELKLKYDFCFKAKQGYIPIAKEHIIKNDFFVKKGNTKIKIISFEVQHGLIKATAYIVKKIAYLSDCSYIPAKSKYLLRDLDFLVIDCLRIKPHPGHFNLDTAISLSKELNPKKTILTNLHVELDYGALKKILPSNIVPAFDGLSFNF